MVRKIDNIIITDNIYVELMKQDSKNVELLTHNTNREIITVKLDDTIITTSRSFGRNEKEAVRVIKKLKDMNFPVAGNPFLIGELIAKDHLKSLNINYGIKKLLRTRFDISPRMIMYSDDNAFRLWDSLFYAPSNIVIKRVESDFVHADVNSFGALVFKKSQKLPKIISEFVEKMHDLKYSENDDCLRRALKYILVGYINTFLFKKEHRLESVNYYPEKLRRTLVREVIDGITKLYLPVGSDLYYVATTIVFSDIAVDYYKTAEQILKKLYNKLNGFILFGDDIYTLKKNVNGKLLNDSIGGLKILEEDIKFLMGSGLPPVFHGLKAIEGTPESGCVESNDCNIVGKREFEEFNNVKYEVIPNYFNFCDF